MVSALKIQGGSDTVTPSLFLFLKNGAVHECMPPGFLEKEEVAHTVGPVTCTLETTQITDKLVASVPSCHSIIVSSICECLRNGTMQNPTPWPHGTHELGKQRAAPSSNHLLEHCLEPAQRVLSPRSPARVLILFSLLDTEASAASGKGLPLIISLTPCRTISWEGLCLA